VLTYFCNLVVATLDEFLEHIEFHKQHAGTAEQQQPDPHLPSRGRRQLKQDQLLLSAPPYSLSAPPNSTIATNSTAAAPSATPSATPITRVHQADTQDAPLIAPAAVESVGATAAWVPESNVAPERAWPTLLTESAPAPDSAADVTETMMFLPSGALVSDSLSPDDTMPPGGDIWPPVGDTWPPTSEPEPPASTPPYESTEDLADEPSGLLPPETPEPSIPSPSATLIDSVFRTERHPGRLRVSVVVITAVLMLMCGLGACVLFVMVRTLLFLCLYTSPQFQEHCILPHLHLFLDMLIVTSYEFLRSFPGEGM
jgi:hypothetical protein